ncbi:DUF3108 domain-containing protein [Fertoebacter nigrum]|uniref:DUF3108 domain-containing protein n=1 Tax=Fertoeibacter niger TaxID=2656921 RepID=A0A8X8H023_9RHOB|nr:DUF3108 domain-containing protein [Fertoeibacter niger]NUB44455.1 DUF3108 domain-containing protein [Fertoeibacter niger]
MAFHKSAVVAVVLALAGMPALAQTDQAVFDLSVRGVGAGTLSFSGTQDGGGYAVTGRLQSGGLLGMVRKIRYDAQARGRISKGRYVPSSYTEKADTGRRQSSAVMEYKGGVPQVKAYDPPREARAGDVDPATMGGSVDPLTALYATLRDVDAGQECKVSLQLFDGRRSTQLRLSAPQAKGDTVVCSGEYRRLAGYSPEDMAEKTRFPFTLTYAPVGEGRMRVVEVAMDSLYGKAALKRR